MLKYVLPIIVALLVLFAAIYAVFAPQEPLPAGGPEAATGPATTRGALARQPVVDTPPPDFPVLPPVSIRTANALIANPFPNDPALAPTLVTLDLHQVDEVTGFLTLAEAAKLPLVLPPLPRIRVPRPLLELQAKNMPALEALFRLEAQSGMIDAANWGETIPLQAPGARVPGEWCVSGPFAVLINAVSHTAQVRPPTTSPAAANATDTVLLQLSSRAEPRAGVLQYPTRLDLTEATDEKGNSLLRPAQGTNPAQFTTSTQFSTSLVYPPKTGGRLIKLLKGTASFLVKDEVQTVTVNDPMVAKPAAIAVGEFTASVGELKWNANAQMLEVAVTYKRGTMPAAAFTTLAQELMRVRPAVEFTGDFGFSTFPAGGSTGAEQAVLNYSIRVNSKVATGARITEVPAVTKLTLELPKKVKPVAVPVEFHDIPLP